jgi:quercetin dioxygenase-like cupin family protein
MQDAFWLLGSHLTILADQQTTAGQYDLIEGRFTPGATVPLHRHTAYAEQVYVLEGEFTVQLDGVTHVLARGSTLMIPVGTPHRLVASSHEPAVALTVAFPSGFARLIQEAGIPAQFGESSPSSPPNMQLFMQLAMELGDELL